MGASSKGVANRFGPVLALALLALTIFAARAWAASGGLDHTFSGDGRNLTAFSNDAVYDDAFAVAVQADGKIVIAGESNQGGTTGIDFALARYNRNGTLDHSFSSNGRVTTAFGNGSGGDHANAVAIQPNGKIVVAGESDQGGTTGADFALARYNSNGSLDNTFSGDGRKTTGLGVPGGSDRASAVAIQANGKIVVGGNAQGDLGSEFALARYKRSGGLDHSFSGNGRKTTVFANGVGIGGINGVAIQANGKIVAAGEWDQSGTGNDFAVARYNRDGSLDRSFSGNGRKTTAVANGAGYDNVRGLAIQANGKIVVAGEADQAGTGRDFALARYNPNGSLDHSFSGDGRKTTAFANGTNPDRAWGIAIQTNGKIVAAGDSKQAGTGSDFALARYNPNGGIDHSFSGDGRKLTAFGNGAGYDDATGVAIQANGKIVVAGYSQQGARDDFAVARYLP